MVMWVFGYGSLIWKAGFTFDDRLVGFIRDYRRVFYQGSTDHRGTPEFPGRTVTLEPAPGDVCRGVAYKVSRKEDEEIALTRRSRLFHEPRGEGQRQYSVTAGGLGTVLLWRDVIAETR